MGVCGLSRELGIVTTWSSVTGSFWGVWHRRVLLSEANSFCCVRFAGWSRLSGFVPEARPETLRSQGGTAVDPFVNRAPVALNGPFA